MAEKALPQHCDICYEEFSEDRFLPVDGDVETGYLSSYHPKARFCVDGCQHPFCRECLADHCKHAIAAREIPIRCPASASEDCVTVLSEQQIHNLLCGRDPICSSSTASGYGSINGSEDLAEDVTPCSSPHWIRFKRCQRLLQDPSLLPCVRCDELISHGEGLELSSNEVTCPSCGHVFCAVHGDGHPGKSCEDYKKARVDRKSERVIRRYTKPCSHCAIPIHKESGCDHIVCVSCKKDMCFKCGTHDSLSGEMVRSCRKCEQSYIDHRYMWRYRMTLCLSLPLYLPLCILHVIFMGGLVVATCGCCCCLGCGIKTDASKRGSFKFEPLKAIRTVLAILLLPLLDLFHQCGLDCCCGLELPGIDEAKTETLDDEDDSEDEDENS